MPFDADPLSHPRIKAALERFFPANVQAFLATLMSTDSMLMGSLPLFCLKRYWATWDMPGDVDVFLPPKASVLVSRSQRVFHDLFVASGYTVVPRYTLPVVLGSARVRPPYYPGHFSVITYTKASVAGVLQVQLITRVEDPGIRNWTLPSADWYIWTMLEFDITCCSVAYDGRTFFVTTDNPDPTNPVTVVRRPTTLQRITKYERRGFIFSPPRVIPFPRHHRVADLCFALLRALLGALRR